MGLMIKVIIATVSVSLPIMVDTYVVQCTVAVSSAGMGPSWNRSVMPC